MYDVPRFGIVLNGTPRSTCDLSSLRLSGTHAPLCPTQTGGEVNHGLVNFADQVSYGNYKHLDSAPVKAMAGPSRSDAIAVLQWCRLLITAPRLNSSAIYSEQFDTQSIHRPTGYYHRRVFIGTVRSRAATLAP
jgi:hypothetical protein